MASEAVQLTALRDRLEADIDYVLDKLPPVIHELRRLSPFGPDKDVSTFK